MERQEVSLPCVCVCVRERERERERVLGLGCLIWIKVDRSHPFHNQIGALMFAKSHLDEGSKREVLNYVRVRISMAILPYPDAIRSELQTVQSRRISFHPLRVVIESDLDRWHVHSCTAPWGIY